MMEQQCFKWLSSGIKRPVYWDNYQTVPAEVINQGTNIYELFSASFQGVNRLFALTYDIAANNEAGIKYKRKYFLQRGKIENHNVIVNGRNFFGQLI